MLSWENLGAQPVGRAFRQSMFELLARPRSFFRKMALSGGLHEPLTFFAVVLSAGLLLAFPAALSYFGLCAPDPERVTAEVYSAHTLPARVAGLLVMLVPVVLVAAGAGMVLLGTLFHLAGKPFGSRNWEGSVSVWLYSASAGLAPLVLFLAVAFVVSLAGYLIGIPWPAARETAAHLARWTWLVLGGAGMLAGAALIVVDAVIGCTHAFELESSQGAGAGVSGLVLVAVALGASVWMGQRWDMKGGLIAVGAWAALAMVFAVVGVVRSRHAQRSP